MNYNNPFIKVTWEDTPENFTSEKINRVKSYFQKKYNTRFVQIITKSLSDIENTKLKSLNISENLSDVEYQKTLMKDFISENKIIVDIPLLDRLDNKVNEQYLLNNGSLVKHNKWNIKKIEFSNFLCFGEGNIINYDELPGITVVESLPENFSGKSVSTTDLLLYLFFGTTTKSKTNDEIFNIYSGLDELYVKGYLTIDDEEYVIERKSNRKKTKKGDYTITNTLEYYKINPDGTKADQKDEQRKKTEKIIKNAIGSEDDFMTTILTTGKNLEDLIDSKPTARGQVITKFLGLENLRQKEEICKKIQSDWSKTLVSNTYNIVTLETDIENFNTQFKDNETEIEKNVINQSEAEVNLQEFEVKKDDALSRRNNDIDPELIKTNVTQLSKDIEELKKLKKKSEDDANTVIVKEPSQYYKENEHEKIKKQLSDLRISDGLNSGEIIKQENLIVQFEKGKVCPTCKRPFDTGDHTEEINEIKSKIEELKKIQETNKKKIEDISIKEKSFNDLKKEFDEYERNKIKKSRHELEIEQKQIEIDGKQIKIDNYNKNKQKLDENQKIDAEISNLRTQIETVKANIRMYTNNIEKFKNNNILLQDKIKVNNELIKKIKSENDTLAIFKVYLTVFGKNGISKVILKNMMPLINHELYNLLVDSCNFIVELEINEKNEVEFIMTDIETRISKPLYSGSGYEKTIASLALRSVLTKISSLPKPNIVFMDETFGKIAEKNFELVGEFYKKIKPYFEHIFVISHYPLIRNWADNLVMVKKENNISSIDYINTKIS